MAPGIASAQGIPMTQQQMMQTKQANMAQVKAGHLGACYGVNAVGRNDCATGTHSCAGQATKANDPASFVLLSPGDCGKLAGGSLKAS
ncbi:MAG TPA: DUF2282 domain-containing protein [Halothiobacillus sp.]|nr:DUF2282 domain-containing protein [Halothiobacillus sp.]